jgi:translation initiation factor 1
MSKKKSTGGLVFSTDPNFKIEPEKNEFQDISFDKQVLRVWLERGRGGKEATVVKGFVGSDDSLTDLAKMIKSKCAAGGSAKDGIIIVQGDHRDKVLKMLLDVGFKNVKKAGG